MLHSRDFWEVVSTAAGVLKVAQYLFFSQIAND